ncbi:MAG: hypothetical protein J0L66_05640 [Cytophagales bacterium]|nr:hypothetical protein [Cytophagales bacterium]
MRFFFLFGLVAVGCAPLYIPTTRNVPLFRERGEFQASVIVSNGVEAQTAVSLTDNIALMANTSILRQKISEPESYTRVNSFSEAGLGYYKVNRRSRLEIFAGYGFGSGTSFAQYYFFANSFGGQQDLVATGKCRRFFIQPSYGQNNRRFNLAFTPRFSVVNFYEFSSNDNTPTNPTVTVMPDEKPRLFLEPALTGKFPLAGNLQGMFQLGLNVRLSGDGFFDYVPLQVALGIQFNSGSLRTRVY